MLVISRPHPHHSDYSGCDGNNDDYGIEHHDTLSQLEMEVIKDHRADTHSPKSFTSITNVSAAVAERVLEKQRTSFNTKGEFNGEKNTIRSLDVLHHKHQRNPLHHAIHGQGSTLYGDIMTRRAQRASARPTARERKKKKKKKKKKNIKGSEE